MMMKYNNKIQEILNNYNNKMIMIIIIIMRNYNNNKRLKGKIIKNKIYLIKRKYKKMIIQKNNLRNQFS